MKIKAGILIFLFLFSTILPIQAATNEGYGEDETSLGQFVDSFKDLNNVSVRVLVERNSTLNAMELNFTTGFLVEEDFTTYTAQDPNNDYTINASTILFTTIERQWNASVYRDYGGGFFGDFQHNFTLVMTDIEAGDATGADTYWPYSLTNANLSFGSLIALGADARADAILLGIRQEGANDDLFRWRVLQITNGGATFNLIQGLGTNNPMDTYYITISRTGNTVDYSIYTDEARTALNFNYNNAGGDNTQYRFVGNANQFSASDGTDYVTGAVKDLNFGDSVEGYSLDGYFTTTNYLNYADGATLVQLTNTTIPAGTGITVEFSDDNSTWVNPTVLTEGFHSIDLRTLNFSSQYYLRGNLTGPGTDTPRFYQSRLITTQGIPIVQNVTGEWIDYNASEIDAIVGTVDAGLLNSTFFVDVDTFDVSEVVGIPGMLISVNFTGIDEAASCLWLNVFYEYDGNLNHDFDIELWDFTASVWVDDSHLIDTVGFVWENSTIYDLRIPNDFLSGGEVKVQFNHEAAGNINHDLFIDYVRLQAFIPSDVAPAEPFQFFWIVIAIALMIVGIVLARMWPEEGDP